MEGHGLDSVLTVWGLVSGSTQVISKAAYTQSSSITRIHTVLEHNISKFLVSFIIHLTVKVCLAGMW